MANEYAVSAAQAVRSFFLVLGFTLLTTLAAQVHIPLPFTPVPITLQTLAVLLAGAFLGPWRGGISQFLYVVWGAIGLPMFAGTTTGLAILAGPSGGYIVGFFLAALYVGGVMKNAQGTAGVVAVFFFGSAIILFAGWAHMTLFYTHFNGVMAFRLGVLPFLPGNLVKIAAATGIYLGVKRLIKN